MKRIILFLLTAFVMFACNKDDNMKIIVEPVDFTVSATYDQETYGGEVAAGATVVLNNTESGDQYTATTDAAGEAFFESILPGTYNITISQVLSSTGFESTFGYSPSSDEVAFNGSLEQVTVNEESTIADVSLVSSRVGDLLIKQIYYAGSSTSEGALFRDQFIEVYNNSTETIYADGLYIGQLYGKTNANTDTYTQSSGQYDWTQSIGMSDANANTNYVYADYVIQIPGTGETYPILPGESIVIAQTGINHKEPFVDNDGDPVSVSNPELTVDLSGADFEVYLGDFRESIGEEPYQWDIQNPSVTDVSISYWGNANKYSGNRDLILDNLGRDSFVIFQTEDFATYTDYPDPSVDEVSEGSTRYYLQIPTDVIIDGVELQHYNPSSARPKMIPTSVDAGSISCDASYNSQSVIRKTKTTVNGRVVLEDTNNTSDDFVKLAKANPGGFNE